VIAVLKRDSAYVVDPGRDFDESTLLSPATALTFVLASCLVEQTKRGTGLGSGDMIASRGGNDQAGKCNGRCDMITGVYLGCAKVGGNCTQCGSADDEGNFVANNADFIGEVARCGKGGFKEIQPPQDCGTIWTGTCAADPTSPTGFKCVGTDTMNVCSNGVLSIGAQ
jgi:hypothetical protein